MGLEVEESERLLDEVWSYVEAAVYKHRWALGDLVLWTTAPPCTAATLSIPSRAA